MELIKVCYGCLSSERKLTPIKEHAKLYQQLLTKKSNNKIKNLFMCWECHKVLINIHTFRLKIMQAQRFLCNNSLLKPQSLSNLTMLTKIDDYQLIIYEDEKINIIPEADVEIKKELCEYEAKTVNVELDINNMKEEFKNEDFDNHEASGDFDDNIDDTNDAINGIMVNINEIKVKEPNEALVPIEMLNKKDEIKVQQRKKRPRVLKMKYRTIIMDNIPDKRSLYEIISIDQKDAKMELEKKKEKRKNFRCSLCYSGFPKQENFDRHMKMLHNQKNVYECDVCGCRYKTMSGVRRHVATHFLRFKCKLCAQEFNMRGKVYMHFKHGPHARQMECKKCNQRFDCRYRKEFFDHYRNAHEFYTCDYCGGRRTTKSRLAQHIKTRHTDVHCKPCNMSFSSHCAYKKHNERKHTTDASERNYCVECDVQFANGLLYEEHVTRSIRHNPRPRVKCPECDKTYSKNSYMRNHYDLVHMKATKYVCPLCERNFLNGFRLRCHIKFHHEKMPKPKNRICNYCGKAFSTRRILDNHVRTHTGERPYACALCPAAFAQSTPLKTHMRSAHK